MLSFVLAINSLCEICVFEFDKILAYSEKILILKRKVYMHFCNENL